MQGIDPGCRRQFPVEAYLTFVEPPVSGNFAAARVTRRQLADQRRGASVLHDAPIQRESERIGQLSGANWRHSDLRTGKLRGNSGEPSAIHSGRIWHTIICVMQFDLPRGALSFPRLFKL
ncbi:MAG: hypothetical protein R3D83_01285 [Caenibius sp.]